MAEESGPPAGEPVVIQPAPARMVVPPHTVGLLDVRVRIAELAMRFFDPEQPNPYADALGKPSYDRENSLTGEDFRQHLLADEEFFTTLHSIVVHPVLRDMARADLLYDHGITRATDGMLGHAYQAIPGSITNAQRGGSLWLSRALGAALIIENYRSVTVHMTGTAPNGDVTNASGLVLDAHHILTNAHVVRDCSLDPVISSPEPHPALEGEAQDERDIRLRVVDALVHDTVDVAVIPLDVGSPPLNAIPGVAFRNPQWSDDTYVFGYPPISTLDGPYLVVQRGEAVNPAVRTRENEEYFLYSSIARPGNSGGPVVAQDGRVVGLVARDLPDARQISSPFYGGVSAGEIRRALGELGVADLIQWEDWHY
ncbi:S1 family peptidase [Mycobacterium sp. 48b]|uniref:S1 family peptidase n=1 Tax=Mycobacterium sp. 48b TaxID=3400426 RepID=UPI003AAC85A6